MYLAKIPNNMIQETKKLNEWDICWAYMKRKMTKGELEEHPMIDIISNKPRFTKNTSLEDSRFPFELGVLIHCLKASAFDVFHRPSRLNDRRKLF